MGPIQSLSELTAFAARRLPLIFAIMGLCIIGAILVAVNSAPTYQSIAILSARVAGSVGDDANNPTNSQIRLLQLVEQRLTNRETLLELAERYDMFTGLEQADRTEAMRSAITLVSQEAATVGFGSDGSVASIIIQGRADSANKAASLTNDLARMLMERTQSGREERVRNLVESLSAQKTRLEAELRDVEAQSRAFVDENFELMPVNVEVRRTEYRDLSTAIQEGSRTLNSLEAELQTIRDTGGTQRRRIQIETQLSPLRTELEQSIARRDALDDLFRRAARAEREIVALEARQERLQGQLDAVSDQLTDAELGLGLGPDGPEAIYEVVEPAAPSNAPVSRSRKMIVILGAVAGLGLGGIIAFMTELLVPRLRSPAQLERECAMRPVMVIPKLTSAAEIRKQRIGWAGGGLLLALAFVAALLASIGG